MIHPWHSLMGLGLIKTVQGPEGTPYRTVPLGVAVTVFIFLASAIGAQQTVIWTAQHEREAMARTVSTDVDTKIARAVAADDAVTALHFATLDAEVRALQDRLNAAQHQIDINTGKLEQGAAWRGR